MEISVSLPLDEGFLRRQCPSCARQFKWHHGPTPDRPDDFADPPIYYCPYCGEAAATDEWLTDEQREYVVAMVTGPAMHEATDDLNRIARKNSNDFIKLTVEPSPEPEPPNPLVEPNDMTGVAAPCHPWEPVRVDDDWAASIHCLVCGELFAV